MGSMAPTSSTRSDRDPLAATVRLLDRRDEPAPRDDQDARRGTACGPRRPAAGRHPGARSRSSSSSTGRPSRVCAASGSRPGSPSATAGRAPPMRSSFRPSMGPESRRRGGHGGAPGRHRRPRPSLRGAATRRPDGGLEVAARPPRGGAAASRHRSAIRGRRGRSGPAHVPAAPRPARRELIPTRPARTATPTTGPDGSRDAAPRRSAAIPETPERRPGRAVLVGCRREPHRHDEPALDPDPRGHRSSS